ncbi:tyrosine recombinase [bacterium]|nr:tyrosine recombinase [bacterium]NBX78235.1 tyrosine recombinase [bacterium]
MFNYIIHQFEHYLLVERMVATNTVESYTSDMEQFFNFISKKFPEKKLQDITPDDVKLYIEFLRKRVRLTASSASRKLSALKTFLGWAKKAHGAPDFMDGVAFPKLGKVLPNHLPEEDIELLLETATKDTTAVGMRNRMMLTLMYVCGVRVSELVEMTISHIQFNDHIIRILGKGSKERVVPMPLQIGQMLQQYIEQIHPLLCGAQKQTDYLFPVLYAGKPRSMTRQSFWLILKKIVAQSGIDAKVSPHVLRHSVATHLLKKGANLRLLQMILGHSQLETVQVYTHVDMRYLRIMYDQKHPRA